jgi:hypothetical protein
MRRSAFAMRCNPGSMKIIIAARVPGLRRVISCRDTRQLALDTILHTATDLPVVPLCRRQFPCDVGQIRGTLPRIPRPPGGAYRDRHGRWTREAMAAGSAKDECASRGRRSRVVLTPRRWREVSRRCCASRWMTVTKKPDRRRERGISRKAIAQGMPDRFGEPVVTNSCAFYFCTRGCGRAKRPAFLLPLPLRDNDRPKPRAKFVARMRDRISMNVDFLDLCRSGAENRGKPWSALSFRPFGARTPPRSQPPHPWRLAAGMKRAALRPLTF